MPIFTRPAPFRPPSGVLRATLPSAPWRVWRRSTRQPSASARRRRTSRRAARRPGRHLPDRRPHLRRARTPTPTSSCAPCAGAGFGEGDAVALLCGNRAEFAETWAACNRAGLPAHQRQLAPHARRVGLHRPRLPGAARSSPTPPHAGAVPPRRARASSASPSAATCRASSAGTTCSPPRTAPTSTTRRSAPRCSTRRAPPATRRASPSRPTPTATSPACRVYSYRDGNVHLCTGPLYHAAPFAIALVPPLSCGVPVVMMERWDAEETLALIDEHRVTHTAPRADDVPPAAVAARRRARALRRVVAARHRPRRRAVPGAGEAGGSSSGSARSCTSTTRPPRATAPASTAPRGSRKPGTVGRADPEPPLRRRPRRRAAARRRGGARVDQGHRHGALRVLRRRRQDRVGLPRRLLHPRRRRPGRRGRLPLPHRPLAPTSSSPAA